MTIERRYEPDPEGLERVVEVLYHLLVEPSGSRAESAEPPVAEAETSTCVPEESE
jgi:hypothetical protein